MSLRLTLENIDKLPDGGPVSVSVVGRGLDIGRHEHLDWTLPDPSRFISGKHCEVRFRDGDYWLHDVSRNGTFVNGSAARLADPYKLRNGDRVLIGPYIVAVEMTAAGARAAVSAPAMAGDDPWAAYEEAAAPEDRAAFRAAVPVVARADFLDAPAPPPLLRVGAAEVDVWGPPPPPPPPPALAESPAPTPAPTPRRPAETASAAASARPPADLVAEIAVAAGLPATAFAAHDPSAVAAEIGAALRLTADRLSAALHARDETRMLIRSAGRPPARGANPLEYAADGGEALSLLFAARGGKLEGVKAFERGFADLERHQLQLFEAMRATLERMFEDLAPDRIDASVPADRGLVPLAGPRKSRLWDVFVERWRAVSRRADNRLGEAFMALIGEAYDKLGGAAR